MLTYYCPLFYEKLRSELDEIETNDGILKSFQLKKSELYDIVWFISVIYN